MIQWFVAQVPSNKKTIIQYPKPFKKYAYPLAMCYDYPDSNDIPVGSIAPRDNESCFARSCTIGSTGGIPMMRILVIGI